MERDPELLLPPGSLNRRSSGHSSDELASPLMPTDAGEAPPTSQISIAAVSELLMHLPKSEVSEQGEGMWDTAGAPVPLATTVMNSRVRFDIDETSATPAQQQPPAKYVAPVKKRTIAGTPCFSFGSRCVRLTLLAILLSTAFALWVLVVAVFGKTVLSEPFHAAHRELLNVKVSGCDVEVVPGIAASVEVSYVIWGRSTEYEFERWGVGLGPGHPNVRSVRVSNPDGCKDTVDRRCHDVCHVTITVPSDTYGLWVNQEPNDASELVEVRVKRGVRMQELRVVGLEFWSSAGPSISVFIEPDVEIDNVAAYTDGGAIQSFSQGIKAVDFWSLQNNVRFVNWELVGDDALIKWRQPENKICIYTAGDAPGPILEDPDPWKHCDISSLNNEYLQELWSAFDGNSDGLIDTTELIRAFGKSLHICCGGDCPFFSFCESYEAEVFQLDTSTGIATDNRAAIMTNANFAIKVQQLNRTFWVPMCSKEVALPHPQPNPSGMTLRGTYNSAKPEQTGISVLEKSVPFQVSLKSEGGEVEILAMQGKRAAGVNETILNFWAPQARIGGVRMLKKDADRIRLEITDLHGMPGQSDDIYVVIDVMPSRGVPRSRWIYTANEFYLSLEPLHLQFLSAGLLRPDIKYYAIGFTNTHCETLLTSKTGESSPATDLVKNRVVTAAELAQMLTGYHGNQGVLTVEMVKDVYEQLEMALLPLFQRVLHGRLVLVNGTHRPAPLSGQLVAFRRSVTGGASQIQAAAYRNPFDTYIRAGAVISIAIAAVASTMILSAVLSYTRFVLKRRAQTEKLRKRLMVLNMEKLSDHEELENVEGDAKARTSYYWNDDITGDSFNPFEMPLELLRQMLVSPIRRSLIKSLDRFLSSCCHVYIAQKTGSGSEKWQPLVKAVKKKGLKPVRHLPSFMVGEPAGLGNVAWQSGMEDPGGSLFQRGQEPVISLSKFFKEYAFFCFEEDLKAISNLNTLQRELVRQHGTLIRLLKVRQLSGCRFREIKVLIAAQRSGIWPAWSAPIGLPRESQLVPSAGRDIAPLSKETAEAILAAFMKACVEPTGNPGDKLDVWRCSRDKEPIGGLSIHMAIGSWCDAFGVLEPNMAEIDLHTVAAAMGEGITYKAVNVKEVRGVELKDMSDPRNRPRYAKHWYLIEALTVLTHVVIMLLLPCICIPLALNAQYTYAASTAPPGSSPLMWYHVMQLWPDLRGKESALIVEIMVWFNIGYMTAALLHIFTHYLRVNIRLSFVRIIRKVFGAILLVYLWLVITYVCLLCVWFSLAAIMEPTRFLPYGTAVITVLAVMLITWQTMSRAAEALENALREAFRKQISSALHVSGAAEHLALSAQYDGLRRRKGKSTPQEQFQSFEVPTRELQSEDVFDYLNADGDDCLDITEFRQLFQKLDLSLTRQQQDRLFAYCDIDCTNTISREEFGEGWEYIMDEIVQQTTEELGLDTPRIILVVTSIVVLLVLWFAFLFLLISSWSSHGSFQSAVQSVIVAGSGTVSSKIRQQSEVETGRKDVGEIVSGVMQKQEGLDDTTTTAG